MKIDFIKCHGSGNDFILLDGLKSNIGLNESELAEFSALICNRRSSVGADGVLLLLPDKNADARMRIFNSDGSEAAMCGNGIRCVARLAYEITGKKELSIATMKAILSCRMEEEISPGVISSSVLIDNVSLVSDDFPFAEGKEFIDKPIPGFGYDHRFTAVSMGNPHIVSFTEHKISDELLTEIGIKANAEIELFPQGVNVTFFNVKDPQTLFAVTYERGVGLTSACGTAMSASTLAACIMGLSEFGKWTDVHNKGGMVKCLAEKHADKISVRLLGNATFEYSASVDYSGGLLKGFAIDYNNDAEKEAYCGFVQSIERD